MYGDRGAGGRVPRGGEGVPGREQPEQLVRWYYGDPSRLAEVEALVMEDNVVEWAMGKMKVEDKPTDFDELMGTKKG